VNDHLIRLLLGNFWRLVVALLCFGLGVLWAIFGWQRTLVILAVTALGWMAGKWLDDGRPTAGIARKLKRSID